MTDAIDLGEEEKQIIFLPSPGSGSWRCKSVVWTQARERNKGREAIRRAGVGGQSREHVTLLSRVGPVRTRVCVGRGGGGGKGKNGGWRKKTCAMEELRIEA